MMTALCVTGPPDACYGLKNGCLVSHLRTTWNARAFMFQFICTSFAVVSLYIFLLPGQDVPIKWNCSVSEHCFSDFPCQSPCCLTVLCMSSCHFGFPCSTGFFKISFYLSFCHSISCIPQWIYYFLTPTLWFDIFKVDSILSIRKKIHSNPVSLKMYFFLPWSSIFKCWKPELTCTWGLHDFKWVLSNPVKKNAIAFKPWGNLL